MVDGKQGWAWFDPNGVAPAPELAPDDGDAALSELAARCFRGADGERLLAHLRSLTLDRALGPAASDAVLRHTEGQRQLVAYIAALVRRGQRPGT